MKTWIFALALGFVAASMLEGTVLADPSANRAAQSGQEVEERTVFVTGSLIPRRIKLRPIGTTTVSPVRIIDRSDIDGTGRYTTPGAFVNEPSVRVLGH